MIGVIVQARSGSSRFPRKIWENINGKYTLQMVLEGVTRAQLPHKIILAMPEYDQKEFEQRFNAGEFQDIADDRFCTYFGHPEDLLDRYFQAARQQSLDLIIRITADTPLVQGNIIDEMVIEYSKQKHNGYMGNNEIVSTLPYPDGVDVEIFPYWMLAETYQLAQDPADREHVCTFMYRRGTEYNLYEFKNCRPNTTIDMKFGNFSFDTYEDLMLIKEITREHDKHNDLNRAIRDTTFTKLERPKES